jgi:DNA-binding LytR/AlgR family response regulator
MPAVIRDGLRQIALQAFEAQALDYLLKPFGVERFIRRWNVRAATWPAVRAVSSGSSRGCCASRRQCTNPRACW